MASQLDSSWWYRLRSAILLRSIVQRCGLLFCIFFFFFQAEDGIRDRNVTGVQTCALPILRRLLLPATGHRAAALLQEGDAQPLDLVTESSKRRRKDGERAENSDRDHDHRDRKSVG